MKIYGVTFQNIKRNFIFKKEAVKAINNIIFHEGDIVLVDLRGNTGHKQRGIRPAVIVSNDVGNKFSPTVKIIPATTKRDGELPTHAFFKAGEIKGLTQDTTFLAECEEVIDKEKIIRKIGTATEEQMEQIALAMAYSSPVVGKAFLKNKVHETPEFRTLEHFYK